MKPGARIAAAIDVLDTVLNRHQPTGNALADWGKANRFAGSGDRNAIGHLVYDALRHRAASAYVLAEDTPRALVLGGYRFEQRVTITDLAAMCTGEDHSAARLSADEASRLENLNLAGAPPWVTGNYPEWLHASFERVFGEDAPREGKALAERAPADLRVNTLKSAKERVLKALAGFGAIETAWSPLCVRIPAPAGFNRIANLQAEACFQAGWCEIQDEGSQVAAALTGASPRLQVLDFCAGGGGKTLAMAAAMQNTGQIYAYDDDRTRLKPIFERIRRANVRNVQVLSAGDTAALDALGPRFDTVLADAPCTGSGTWRRRPDAKWRLKPQALAARQREQQTVLGLAAKYVKPGGRLVYVTCSVLPEENGDQVQDFLEHHKAFSLLPFAEIWPAVLPGPVPVSAGQGTGGSLLLTPASHATDGFFIAVLTRNA